jgi:F420-dependent oxidoreductase-like protein
VRLGLDVAQHQLEWPEILRRVRFAEEASFDGAWVFDHFKPNYLDARTGEMDGPCLEGWTLLAALAASTSRIRLGALVTGMTYRLPSILATEVVTVDHVSDGRLELGLGAAWFEAEHRELGVPFPPRRARLERLEEGVQVIKLMMTEDRATFEGRHYRLESATYLPRPVQKPHPPVWIGAGGEGVSIPIAARHADVWHAFGSPETLARKARVLEEHAERAGRDPSTILRATDLSISETWDDVRRRAAAFQETGIGYLVVDWPTEGWGRLEEFVETVMPALGT